MFATPEIWRTALEQVKQSHKAVAAHHGHLGESGTRLYTALEQHQHAHIDMSQPEALERGFAMLEKMVDELETLLSPLDSSC